MLTSGDVVQHCHRNPINPIFDQHPPRQRRFLIDPLRYDTAAEV